VSSEFSIGFGRQCVIFSLEQIKNAVFLASIAFDNSHITKIHDSLLMYWSSPLTFIVILQRQWTTELLLTSWLLTTTSITLLHFNTKTRCDLLESGYWILPFYEELLITVGLPEGVSQKASPGPLTSLYYNDQLYDSLNPFNSLISIIREFPTPMALDHVGG
jgi:hypothetical protein